MSFVRIVEEKNPVEMHNKVYEASKNNALTPEFCMEILSHTNMPIIMKEILEKIEKKPIEEQRQYKEVILSMFDGRQTSEKIKNKALELAKNLGFDSELNKVIKKTGEGGYSARNGVRDEMFVIDKAGDYRDVDFSSYKGVIVKGEIEEKIKFGGEFLSDYPNHTLSGVLDLRGAKKVDLSGCDLSKVTKIIFEEGASVSLSVAKNLPTNLDVSMCDEVSLSYCDLIGFDLKFKEGAKVYLDVAENLSTNLDVSMCDKVDLRDCDLEGINLKFRKGAEVNLSGTTNLPTNLDVSMCECVLFSERTDFGVMYADISNVKELKFKNEKQMKDSQVKIPEGWKGKIIYTDDEKQMPIISRENDGR